MSLRWQQKHQESQGYNCDDTIVSEASNFECFERWGWGDGGDSRRRGGASRGFHFSIGEGTGEGLLRCLFSCLLQVLFHVCLVYRVYDLLRDRGRIMSGTHSINILKKEAMIRGKRYPVSGHVFVHDLIHIYNCFHVLSCGIVFSLH